MVKRCRWVLVSSVIYGLAACGVPGNGPWMRPGEDCMQCHAANGRASSTWTAAGTVYDPSGQTGYVGAKVFIVDANGRAVTMTTNGAGNFYTGETLTPPFQWVAVQADGGAPEVMPSGYSPNGACNNCHQQGGTAGLRITVPASSP